MVEVVADAGELLQHVRAAAAEGGVLHGVLGHAPLHPVALGDLEDEVARDGVHLAAAHALHQQAPVQVPQDGLGGLGAGGQEGVPHAGDGQVPVALAAAVARGLGAHLQAGLPGLEVGLQDAVLDEHHPADGVALIVDGLAATLVGQGAVVDDRDPLGGHPLAQLAGEGAHARQGQIGL